MGYNLKETKRAIKSFGLQTDIELVNILARECISQNAPILDIPRKKIEKKLDSVEVTIDGERYWIVVTENGVVCNLYDLLEEAIDYYKAEMSQSVDLSDIDAFYPSFEEEVVVEDYF